MAKNKNAKQNANNANQLYTYDPNYGFVPVDNNQQMNDPNAYANMNMSYGPNFGPHYGQGYGHGYGQGYGQGYGRFHNYANPMQQNHMNQMNAMQEELNQLRAYIMNNGQGAGNANAIDPNKMREIYTTIDEVAQGKAQPEKLLSLISSTSTDFWKGLAIGAGAILLYNCTPLKDVVGNLLTGFMGEKPQSANDENLDEDGFYIEEE